VVTLDDYIAPHAARMTATTPLIAAPVLAPLTVTPPNTS